MTPKKGGGGSSTPRKHSAPSSSSTSAGGPTVMSFLSTTGSGGNQATTTGTTVGLTAATGTLAGAAPGSTNKRGRKPGPLSKSAREAQRRLNHSIIEKARRTKINDALATLKQLVPFDYLQTREIEKVAVDGNDNVTINEEEAEDDDLDDDDEGGDEEGQGDESEYRERTYSNSRMSASASSNTKQSSSKTNTAPKGGKKQEKEKEFKLEILVRTVVFLQDLLERVGRLEAAVSSSTSSSNSGTVPEHCATCGNPTSISPSSSTTTTMSNTKKRKREYPSSFSPTFEKDLNDAPRAYSQSRTKVARTASSSEFTPDLEEVPSIPRFSPQRQRTVTGAQCPRNTASSSPSSSAEKRLPSISSWLNTDVHPSPLSFGTFVGTVAGKDAAGKNKIVYSPRSTPNGAYLPSPPSSTHCFGPIRTYTSTQVPPLLNLGPGATTSASTSSSRHIGTTSPPMSKSLGKSPAPAPGTSAAARPPSTSPPTPLALTPEDESAASMLLQIASSSSPQFRPINPPAFSSSSSSASSSKTKSTTTSPTFARYIHDLPDPTHLSLYSPHPHRYQRSSRSPHQSHDQPDPDRSSHIQYDNRPTACYRQVETPSSILGIRKY